MTTASDVYSLGVLLYELVAGRRPYRLAETPLDQAIETICVKDPAAPSTVSADVPEDLDAIVMKALRKEPESRYASVREFAEDIERYLGVRPVLARQGTYRYVARKFVRRHRAGVATAAAAGILLTASAALVIRESQVARLERDRAQRRFNEVRRLAHTVIFDFQYKIAALPGSTPVRKELIASVIGYLDRLAKEAAGDPGLQQELAGAYIQIGNVQGGGNENLGDQQGALSSFRKAEQIARALVERSPLSAHANCWWRHCEALARSITRPMTTQRRRPTVRKLWRWPASFKSNPLKMRTRTSSYPTPCLTWPSFPGTPNPWSTGLRLCPSVRSC
jgi:hypothetical protein